MEISFLRVFITVFALVLLAVPGFLLAKFKLLPEKAGEAFSALVLYGCQPMLTFMSFQKTEYTPEIGINMLIVCGLAFLAHFVMIAFIMLVFKNKEQNKKINCLKFASVFGNCGYMGLPFLQTLFSANSAMQGEILIYGAVVIAVFNVLNWTVGIYMITGDRKRISVFHSFVNPPMIALLISLPLFLILKQPIANVATAGSTLDLILEKIMTSFNYLGEMVTPLAMIVLGIRLANINLKQLFLDKWAYVTAFNKLILMSLITMLIVAFLPVSDVVKYGVFFTLSMPSATSTVLFAVKFGGDGDSASVYVLLSTVLSILTIPLMFLLFNGVFM